MWETSGKLSASLAESDSLLVSARRASMNALQSSGNVVRAIVKVVCGWSRGDLTIWHLAPTHRCRLCCRVRRVPPCDVCLLVTHRVV